MAKKGTAAGNAGSAAPDAKCPDSIKRLVDRFGQQSDTVRSPDYNETLIRIDFINPLMKELGWDMDNFAGYAEWYREVVHEDRVTFGHTLQLRRLGT